jgi:flagellar basal-body rod protein FlgG
MVDMITAMRAYEINSKAIKQADEMGQMANNLTA